MQGPEREREKRSEAGPPATISSQEGPRDKNTVAAVAGKSFKCKSVMT